MSFEVLGIRQCVRFKRSKSRTMPYHKDPAGYGNTAIGGVRVGRIAAGRRENSRVDVRGSQNTLINEDACSGRLAPIQLLPLGLTIAVMSRRRSIFCCGAANRL